MLTPDARAWARILKKRRRTLTLILTTAVSIGLVVFLLSMIKLEDLWSALVNVHLPTLYLALTVAALGNLVRAYRWKVLLGDRKIGLMDLFWVNLVRDLFTDIVPARLGSLSYIYVLFRRFNIPVEIGLSTMVVGAVFDSVAILPLILFAVVFLGAESLAFFSVALVYVTVVLFILLMLVLIYFHRLVDIGTRVLDYLVRRWKLERFRVINWIKEKAELTNKDIQEMRARKIYTNVFTTTIVIRIFKFGVYYLVLLSVLLNQGFSFANLSFWKVFLGTAGAELSAALPTHSIAGLGTYEASWTAAFMLLGFPRELAIISGFSFHIIKLAYNILLGLLAMGVLFFTGLRLKARMVEGKTVAEKRPAS